MSTLWITRRLYSLDTSSLDFSRHLYCVLFGMTKRNNPRLTFRVRSWLGSMECSLQPFVQSRNGLCRPSVPFPQTTKSLDSVYTNYKPSAVTMRSYHPPTSYLDVIIPLWDSKKVSLATTNKRLALTDFVEVSYYLTRMSRSAM